MFCLDVQAGHKWVFQHYGTWRWCQTPDSMSFSEQFSRRRTLLLHFSSQSYYDRPTTKFRCCVTPPNHTMYDRPTTTKFRCCVTPPSHTMYDRPTTTKFRCCVTPPSHTMYDRPTTKLRCVTPKLWPTNNKIQVLSAVSDYHKTTGLWTSMVITVKEPMSNLVFANEM